ncbi:uncharacterized protein PGTG_20865 [Puccinia graminis f. sp. tritici CRL 75-36-700-3]|uniref:Uncharacterized protein n=1 Tax=Puccinia graminis f. sp. tritici (strain CRL 75-36-700-3 / race SCCL) TaxID=418459 RepID=H6QPJ8_PUCGT|nr:uncharacterized protein PGTG_20865 [Puccinia graminis f. sp. tritici CRL 75-36-700-3]EHS63883.1 hypothetical protein PGTG_20865 [Puccinia graminis f. sp. tritici CRL 75-36-700-3]
MKLLKSKWTSYNQKANYYNTTYLPEILVSTPTFESIKSMDLSDQFWNMGALTHPDEPWAVNPHVQKGISAYLTVSHCQEELSPVAREARQAIKWAISQESRMVKLLDLLQRENPTDFESELCAKHSCSRLVLDSIYDNLAKKNCLVWMAWNSHCHELLRWSKKYLNMEDPDDRNMEQSWDLVITHCKSMWEKLINQDSIIMELEDHEEYEEEEMLQEEELQTQVENDEDILAGEDEED